MEGNDAMSQEVVRSAGDELESIMRYAKVFVESGMFPDIGSVSKAAVKIMAGLEHGMKQFEAMNSFDIIQGKCTMTANCMGRMIQASGKYNYRVAAITDTLCELEFSQRFANEWRIIGKSSFSIAEARKAGVKNLEKYPRNMLFARAMSNGAKWFCPDVFKTAPYTAEEMGGSPAPEPYIDATMVAQASNALAPVNTQAEENERSEAPPAPTEEEPAARLTCQPPDSFVGWKRFQHIAAAFGYETMPTMENYIGHDALHRWTENLTGIPYDQKPKTSDREKTIEFWNSAAEPLLEVAEHFHWIPAVIAAATAHTRRINELHFAEYQDFTEVPRDILHSYIEKLKAGE